MEDGADNGLFTGYQLDRDILQRKDWTRISADKLFFSFFFFFWPKVRDGTDPSFNFCSFLLFLFKYFSFIFLLDSSMSKPIRYSAFIGVDKMYWIEILGKVTFCYNSPSKRSLFYIVIRKFIIIVRNYNTSQTPYFSLIHFYLFNLQVIHRRI